MDKTTISFDYAESSDAGTLNSGLRKTINEMRLSVLSIGISLAKLKTEKLFKNLGYKSFSQFLKTLQDEEKVDRSSVYRWLNVGLAYINHKSDLIKTGFDDNDGPSKLTYLERALKIHKMFLPQRFPPDI